MSPHHDIKHISKHAVGHEHLDIPDLRILPVDTLLLHEGVDHKRVSRLEQRLRDEGLLKNPPIVAPVPGSGHFVVLDGANRTSAVKGIGCRHVLAQVVDYKSDHVHLRTWYHLITGRKPGTFLSDIVRIAGLSVKFAPLNTARVELANHQILAYVVVPPHHGGQHSEVYTIQTREQGDERQTLLASTSVLNALVDTYRSDPDATIYRVSADDLDELLPYYDSVSGLVVFPAYRPDDIIQLAEAGSYVPTGITRHVITHRALRVNVPLDLLCSDASLEEKNAWWYEQLKRKLAANEIRLYTESTYLFDE